MKDFFKWFSIDTSTALQVMALILTAWVSIIPLKSSLKSTKVLVKSRAKRTRNIIIALTTVSIGGILISNYDGNKDKSELRDSITTISTSNQKLNVKVDTLTNRNERFRSQLDKNSIKQSNLIISKQKESADQLTKAADNLSKIIVGTDSVPVFSFVRVNMNGYLSAQLSNDAHLSVHNLTAYLINYDLLMMCDIKKYTIKGKNIYYIDRLCDSAASKRLPIPSTLLPGGHYLFQMTLSRPLTVTGKARFLITGLIKNKFYEIQIITIYQGQGWRQASRVKIFDQDKLVKTYILQPVPTAPAKVDWDKEFPYKAYNQMGKGNIDKIKVLDDGTIMQSE